MEATSQKFKTVDEYLATLPIHTKKIVQELRETIRKAAPQAEELISYNMPAFDLKGRLVYYAAWKEHIGFYPVSSAIAAFKKELSGYEGAKGSVQFPLNKPLPLSLISKMVKFRVKENLQKAAAKEKRKNKS